MMEHGDDASEEEAEDNGDYIINRVGPKPPDDYYDYDATEQLMDLFDNEGYYGELVPGFRCEMVEDLVLKRRADPNGISFDTSILHAIMAALSYSVTTEQIRELRHAFRFILSRPYIKLGNFDADGFLTIHDLALCFSDKTYMLKLLLEKAPRDYLNAYNEDEDNEMGPLLLACEVKTHPSSAMTRYDTLNIWRGHIVLVGGGPSYEEWRGARPYKYYTAVLVYSKT